MKRIHIWFFVIFLITLPACKSGTQVETPELISSLAAEYSNLGLTDAEIETLLSLEQVDEYPLYTMHYYAPYETVSIDENFQRANMPTFDSSWGCSLFAAFSDSESMLFGRNFDWEYSPAVLLYTDPADGFASISMVDIKYLGYEDVEKAQGLKDSSIPYRAFLLDAPYLPFDGMNEMGLAVGMAAVPPGNMAPDPDKETVNSLLVIREILDHASNIDQAVAILQNYNIDYGSGPPLHYLIADSSGQAALVEYYQSELHIQYNEAAWHQATNFLLASAGESAQGQCWRYDKITEKLEVNQGQLIPEEAISLLSDVSQEGTQWSIVYGMSTGDIHVAMGQAYDDVHKLHLELADQ